MKKVLLPLITLLILGIFSACDSVVPQDNNPPAAAVGDVKISLSLPAGFSSTLLKSITVSMSSTTASGAVKKLDTVGDVLFTGLKAGASYDLEVQAYGNDNLVYLKKTYKFDKLSEGLTSMGLVLVQSRVNPVTPDSPEGTYSSGIELALSTALAGAEILYTLDGSDPSVNGSSYSTKISMASQGDYHIKAVAKKNGLENSPVGDWLYKISSGGLNPPQITPASGTINDDTLITITVPAGATVYYTLDGSTPTAASTKYTGPFKLPVGTFTFKAIAISPSASSSVTTTIFNVLSSTPVAPGINPADGSYETSATVTMTQSAGLPIHYTLDGTNPTVNSPTFPGSFTLNALGTTVIKAIAVNGTKVSAITTRTITIVPIGTLAAPTLSPADGTFENSVTVTMTQPDATEIRYTTDGSTPTATSTLYTGAVQITTKGAVKVQAIARTATKTSSVSVRNYTITTTTPVPTSVTLSASSTNVKPGVEVTFTAVVLDQFGSPMVSEATTIYNGATALPGKTFSSATEGTFTFTAKSGVLTSPSVSVIVKTPDNNPRYVTNPNNQVGKYKTGMNVTCTSTLSDGFTDWTSDMIIAQGAAYDDAKSFYGGHEYPSYDSYALYAAWDDTNLYLGWQFVYVNDIANPSNNGGNEARPTNGDIPQMLVFDTDSTKASIGTMASGKNVWYDNNPTGFNFDLSMGVDKIAMFSSKGGVGTPALFSMNSSGYMDYTAANCVTFKSLGVVYGAVYGLLPSEVWGVKKYPYVPADLNGTTDWVDFVALNHNKSYDTFYEMKIPLTALGLTRNDIETKGIGVMHVSIYGTSGVDSLPADKAATLDNALLTYSQDPSSTKEKEDLDKFTVPLARIGKK